VAAAFLLKPKPIAPEAIRASVVRTPALIECAWQLPVAVTYQRELASQSNGSLCGPASLANAFRSLGEAATREDEVLAGTGKCWTGICVMGLTLDQLAGVARKHTQRAVTVLRDLTRERFRAELRRSNDPRLRYLVNFARKPADRQRQALRRDRHARRRQEARPASTGSALAMGHPR